MNNQSNNADNADNADKDLYAILGLHRLCTSSEIKHAYRLLAAKWHPDRNDDPEAAGKFRDAHMAYTVLSNPTTRQQYDKTGKWNKQINNEEMRIRNDIINLFDQAVDNTSDMELPLITRKMQEAAVHNRTVIDTNIHHFSSQITKWDKVISRIKNKDDDNFIYKYANDKRDQLKLQIEDAKNNKEHWSAVVAAINKIKYDSNRDVNSAVHFNEQTLLGLFSIGKVSDVTNRRHWFDINKG